MKKTLGLLTTMLLCSGCWGTTIEGTISLPANLTPAGGASCADIKVTIRETFLDSSSDVAEATATGDIASGHCEYRLSFQPTMGPFVYYDWWASARAIAYSECGEQTDLTHFDGPSLANLPPLGGSVRLDLTAIAECP